MSESIDCQKLRADIDELRKKRNILQEHISDIDSEGKESFDPVVFRKTIKDIEATSDALFEKYHSDFYEKFGDKFDNVVTVGEVFAYGMQEICPLTDGKCAVLSPHGHVAFMEQPDNELRYDYIAQKDLNGVKKICAGPDGGVIAIKDDEIVYYKPSDQSIQTMHRSVAWSSGTVSVLPSGDLFVKQEGGYQSSFYRYSFSDGRYNEPKAPFAFAADMVVLPNGNCFCFTEEWKYGEFRDGRDVTFTDSIEADEICPLSDDGVAYSHDDSVYVRSINEDGSLGSDVRKIGKGFALRPLSDGGIIAFDPDSDDLIHYRKGTDGSYKPQLIRRDLLKGDINRVYPLPNGGFIANTDEGMQVVLLDTVKDNAEDIKKNVSAIIKDRL